MKKYINLIVIIAIAVSSNAIAGSLLRGIVYGQDSDKKKSALPGATVRWEGGKTGAYTGKDGRFELTRNDSDEKLIVSFVGYKTDTLEIGLHKDFIEITLNSNAALDEIKVTGRQMGTEISKSSIVKTEGITSHGLRKAACCNLSESFETNPSVDVNYSDAVTGAKRIELLGLDGIYTQMLSEKIPTLRGIASSFGLNYVPGPWMESIQISKGAASVSTGYESTTGQINVEYKKPLTSEPLFLNFFANEVGRYEANANTSYKFSDNLGTMLLFHGSVMQNQFDHNSDKFLDMPMTAQINAMNRWFYEGDGHHMNFGFKALYEDRKGGQKGFYPDSRADLFGVGIHTERYEVYGKNGYILDDNVTSIAGIVNANTHYQDSFFGSRKYKARQNSFYLNLLMETGFGGQKHEEDEHGHMEAGTNEAESHDQESCEVEEVPHKISAGLSFQFDEYKESFTGSNMYRSESVPGGFLEYTFTGIENLTFVAGIRADLHNLYGTFVTPRFHARYAIGEVTVIRASAGKGYRVPNIFAENTGLLVSSREFAVTEKLNPEEAWNYGVNFSHDFGLFGRVFTLNAEYYRTDFINQVVTDLETNPQFAYFYNLDGQSYSNSLQFDLTFQPFDRFDITTAYRLIDVKTTINGKLLEKPLQSRHKAFLNLAYATMFDEWQFDLTAQYNGPGRLPNTASNPEEYRLGETFPSFMIYNAQITKNFDGWSLYLGGENLLDYRQPHPILSYDNPGGRYFDASMIWGPLDGRKIYAGIRMEFY